MRVRKNVSAIILILAMALTSILSAVSYSSTAEAAGTARAAATEETASVSECGRLKVQGSRIVDKNGNAVQLRGISTHGIAWYPQYIDQKAFKEFHEKWDASVIRLAMYTEEYGGYCNGGDRKQLKKLIDDGVNYAKDADMYVIIDWHILSDGNPMTNKAAAIKFFKYAAKKYGNYENVLFEICNEPNGGTDWNTIKKYAKKVIPVIRKYSDNIIIVGTPTWSQEVDKALASPLKGDNIMYTMHFYAATHKDDLRKRMTDAAAGGLPIFVTEFGICDASGNGSIDKKEANKWVKAMDKYGISYCMWNLSNKNEASAMIKSSCSKTNGFKKLDLTTSGKWLLNTLTK